MDNDDMGIKEKLEKSFQHIPPENMKRKFLVELTKISPRPDQPRKLFNEEGLRELAASIQQDGQLMPVILTNGDQHDTYILVAGERRFRAHQMLGKTHIEAVLTDGNPRKIALIENLQREDLTPMEEAISLHELMEEEHFKSQDELADFIGKSRITVNETLRLNSLPDFIKHECLTSGTSIPKSTLIQIARIENAEQQRALWEQVLSGSLTVRATRSQKQSGGTKAPRPLIQQVLTSAKGLTKKLESLPAHDLTDDEMYQLFELRQKVTDVIDELNEKRQH